jgi:hypothetical protein
MRIALGADEHSDRVIGGTDRRSVLHYTGSDLAGEPPDAHAA